MRPTGRLVYERMFVGTGTPRKPWERAQARELRKAGVPIKRIAAALGVSPSSVLYWTRDIQLTAKQRQWNLRGPSGPQNPERVAQRAAAWRRRCQRKRLEYQREGRALAREQDPLHMAGCMLYWAEGSKSRNQVHFANSDLNMVRFFCDFLRTSLGVRNEDRLPYGVCSVRLLKSTRLVQHIFGAIQEYAGFEEPRWLDGPPIKRRPRKKRTATVDR